MARTNGKFAGEIEIAVGRQLDLDAVLLAADVEVDATRAGMPPND